MTSSDVTALLVAWTAGDASAGEQLFPLVYSELRRRAAVHLRGERRDHTLQPTALVNEAFLRLLNQRATWQNRAHFLAIASRLMRRVLVDHARHAERVKRAGGIVRVTLGDSLAAPDDATPQLDCIALDRALTRLAQVDERKARIAELRFFGGLSLPETAHVLELSVATIERDWRTTRAWLHAALEGSTVP